MSFDKMTVQKPDGTVIRQPLANAATRNVWWDKDLSPTDTAQAVGASIEALSRTSKTRMEQCILSARLYGQPLTFANSMAEAINVRPGSANTRLTGRPERVRFNVISSVIDTLQSKTAKMHPRPQFLSTDGTYKEQKRCQRLNTFCDGAFYEAGYEQLSQLVSRDAAVWGTGILHAFKKGKRAMLERVFPFELMADEVEAVYGQPRQLHRFRIVDKRVLARDPDFKEHATAIMAQSPVRPTINQGISDSVLVFESWHLPSGEGAEDGRRCITMGATLLHTEEWKRDDFPFSFLHFSPRLSGFWGQGLAEQLTSIQVEINKLLFVITRSLELGGTYKWLVENSSKISTAHLSNALGAIIKYAGTKPEVVLPPIVQPELYQQLLNLKQSAYEQAGISQLSAQSQKPEGLNSGRALRNMVDIESDRFQVISQAYEQLAVDTAHQVIEVAKEIGGSFTVRAPRKGGADVLKWSEVQMDRDAYVIQCFPVSALPKTPAGRLQTVTELTQAGFITKATAQKLLDLPDIDAADSLMMAQEDYLQQLFEKILDDGEYTAPDELDNLDRAHELALQIYSRARVQGVEEPKLEMIRNFIVQVQDLKKAAMPPPPALPPGAPGAGAPPPANPTPTPTSDLVPNVNGATA
jgi:hypothetical protein